MTMTLGEMLQELESHRYDLATWTLLENVLCKYVDQDKHRQAEAGLKVQGCSESYVPAHIFERIIDRLRSEEIEPLNERIAEIEGFSVQGSDDEEDIDEEEVKKPIRKKGTRKKSRTKTRTKGLRSVRGGTRQKSSGRS